MNCLDGLKELDNNSIQLVVTSPPYDNLRTYKGYSFPFKEIVNELYRVTDEGGVSVWVVGDGTVNGGETGTSFRQALYFMEVGFILHDTMIYQKHNPTPNTGNGVRYQQSFEYMFIFSKGKPKTIHLLTEPRRNECKDKRSFRMIRRQRNVDGEFEQEHLYVIRQVVPKSNIWNYKVGLYNTTSDKIAFKHPAIFPEQLAIDHILSWSNEGDLVLDPFMGSGTVAKACIITKRNYIGFEISEEFCKIANERIISTSLELNNGVRINEHTEMNDKSKKVVLRSRVVMSDIQLLNKIKNYDKDWCYQYQKRLDTLKEDKKRFYLTEEFIQNVNLDNFEFAYIDTPEEKQFQININMLLFWVEIRKKQRF
jgi:site-specific DNA-methyltransferase (adenine-specific)